MHCTYAGGDEWWMEVEAISKTPEGTARLLRDKLFHEKLLLTLEAPVKSPQFDHSMLKKASAAFRSLTNVCAQTMMVRVLCADAGSVAFSFMVEYLCREKKHMANMNTGHTFADDMFCCSALRDALSYISEYGRSVKVSSRHTTGIDPCKRVNDACKHMSMDVYMCLYVYTDMCTCAYIQTNTCSHVMSMHMQKASSPRIGLSRQLPLADICRKSLTLAATLLDSKVGDVQMANLGGKPPAKLTAELAKVCLLMTRNILSSRYSCVQLSRNLKDNMYVCKYLACKYREQHVHQISSTSVATRLACCVLNSVILTSWRIRKSYCTHRIKATATYAYEISIGGVVLYKLTSAHI
jgi:hypothetical protein